MIQVLFPEIIKIVLAAGSLVIFSDNFSNSDNPMNSM